MVIALIDELDDDGIENMPIGEHSRRLALQFPHLVDRIEGEFFWF